MRSPTENPSVVRTETRSEVDDYVLVEVVVSVLASDFHQFEFVHLEGLPPCRDTHNHLREVTPQGIVGKDQ